MKFFRAMRMAAVIAGMAMGVGVAKGQTTTEAGEQTTTPPAAKSTDKKTPAKPPEQHRFWNKENAWLFASVGAGRTLDYFSTLNLRRRGDQEWLVTNDLVDDHPAFAVVEAAGTGLSIGASYLFHRSGHHKLERWTSIVHFGVATGGAVRNYCLKTAHPSTTTP